MKLEAKQRLLSYYTWNGENAPVHFEPVPFTFRPGMRQIKNAHPTIKVFYKARGATSWFWFVKKDTVLGRAELETPQLAHVLPFKKVLRPHIDFAQELAGSGIATSFYLIALNMGVSLATTNHTVSAKKLWDRVATMPGVHNYWFDRDGKQLAKNTRIAIRVLSKEVLK